MTPAELAADWRPTWVQRVLLECAAEADTGDKPWSTTEVVDYLRKRAGVCRGKTERQVHTLVARERVGLAKRNLLVAGSLRLTGLGRQCCRIWGVIEEGL